MAGAITLEMRAGTNGADREHRCLWRRILPEARIRGHRSGVSFPRDVLRRKAARVPNALPGKSECASRCCRTGRDGRSAVGKDHQPERLDRSKRLCHRYEN